MEEALSFHVAELTKTRADYDSLYEKFKTSNTLIEEKDKLHQQKLLNIELSNKKKTEKYLKKIYEQNMIIKGYLDSKEKFENDVKVLEEAATLLEEREQVYLNRVNELKDGIMTKDNNISTLNSTIKNLKLNLDNAMNNTTKLNNDIENYQRLIEHEMIPKANYNVLQNTITKFTADIENYQKIIKNEMVPKSNYDLALNNINNLNTDIENYQNILKNDMMPKTQFDILQNYANSLKADAEYYQEIMKNDMVSKNNYDNLYSKYEELLIIYENDTRELITKIETEKADRASSQSNCSELQNHLNKMVPAEEYEKLKQILQQALEDKRVAEESANIINKMRDGYLNDVNEAEARIASLKGRVERSERELRDSAAREDNMKATINQIEMELEALNEEYTRMQDRCLGLENSKASLLTQLGNIKLNSRRESEVRTQLNQTIQQLEKQIVDDQLKFKEQFAEANANFGVLTKDLEAKIHDREKQVDSYRNAMKENDVRNETMINQKLKRIEELERQLLNKDEEIAKRDDHISILGSAVKDLERSKGLLEEDSEIQKKFIEDLLRKYSFQSKTMNDLKQQLDVTEKVSRDLKAQVNVYQGQLEEIRLTALEELGEIEDASTVQYNNINMNPYKAIPHKNIVTNDEKFPKMSSPNSISQLTANTNVSIIPNNNTNSRSKISMHGNFDLPTPTHLNIDNDDTVHNDDVVHNDHHDHHDQNDRHIINHDHDHNEHDNICNDDYDQKDVPNREDEKDEEIKEEEDSPLDINDNISSESKSEVTVAVSKTPSSIKSNRSYKSSKSSKSTSSSSSTFSKLTGPEKMELKQIEKRLNEFKKLVR